ncbi:related to Heat shock factor protein 4 [Melanopsichium pennsylvanicum]|uniref:Related to Heat shock factor protein 4 n=2 Tax=Melanopsichium pennsylvanicum TaxID=63383 RepID=A0AAJ4XRU6_9BASI|nr:related to Heat shock factor protein 4 [Melanopsichium pennsylvanicum 4]SNX87364.1 related to Heat shock factor protein 4 [Melanopsichium pennsylvanicum]
MNGIENGQTFDPAFDAFFQAPSSSSHNHQLQHPISDSPLSQTQLGNISTAETSFGAFGNGQNAMRPSSSGGNLHLNISNLSVKGEAEHQQRLRNTLNYANASASASSPQSNLPSPADAASSINMPSSSTSPLLHPDGSSFMQEQHSGAPTASSNLQTEHNMNNDTRGITTAMRSYSSTSIKSANSQNADSPSSAFGGIANQSMGDASVDDPNATNQSDADLAAEKRQSSKFVYKLFRMVGDPDYQHLISWNRNGTSVMVCNFDEFAKEVLGKHFKHSNFSSFIRQLNMYGFYKVNKTPRGHRQSVDAQIWEFSHPKFLRGRPDLLDDIRRKALDSEHARVEARDLQYSVSVGQMQLRQQIDEMHFRLEELTEQNMALRTFTTQLRDVLGLVLEHVKKASGGNLAFDVRIPTLDLPSPMPPQGLWTPQGHDGPPIFVTEPEFGAGVGPGGLRMGPSHGLQGMHGPPQGFGGPADGFGMAGTPISRRVSSSSTHSESMLAMNGSPMHGSMQGEAVMMAASGMPQRSASFGEGQMPPPQFNIGRGGPGSNRPGLAGLAIDTSAASGMFGHGGMHHGISPTSAGLSASNAGLGVMSIPPSPLTPQHQAMMAAINTPLPPSPAPGVIAGGQFKSFEGSPFIANNGFPAYGHNLNMADHSFFGPDGEGPNAKAMRTPMKRTASNSGPSAQGTPMLMQNATSPGLAKRKSPV